MCNLPTIYNETMPTASIEHKCCECHKTIKPGDKYLNITGKWDGDFMTFKQCDDCTDICKAARSLMSDYGLFDDEGPAIGELFTWIDGFTDINGNMMADDLGVKL
jgi:hypothetical protein